MGILIVCLGIAIASFIIYKFSNYEVSECALLISICAAALVIILCVALFGCNISREANNAKLAVEYQTLIQNYDNPFALEAITNWNGKVAAGQALQKNWWTRYFVSADWSKFQPII